MQENARGWPNVRRRDGPAESDPNAFYQQSCLYRLAGEEIKTTLPMPAPPGRGQNSTHPGSLHARRRGQRPATGLRVRSAITPKIRRLGPVVGHFISPVSPRAVDRGGNRPGGWGQGRGLAPIGANLPHRCTAFRVGYRRGASSVEPPCRFWWTRSIPRLTQAVDRGGHRSGGWGPGRGLAPSPQAAELVDPSS